MTGIRIATAGDLPAIVELDRRCSPVFDRPERYAALLAPQKGLVLIADGEEACRGFAAWSTVVDEASLLNVAVAETARGKGVARGLLRRGAALLQSRGARRLLLEVRASNHAARGLYESLGFHADGRRVAYYPGDDGVPREDAVLMSCDMEMADAHS